MCYTIVLIRIKCSSIKNVLKKISSEISSSLHYVLVQVFGFVVWFCPDQFNSLGLFPSVFSGFSFQPVFFFFLYSLHIQDLSSCHYIMQNMLSQNHLPVMVKIPTTRLIFLSPSSTTSVLSPQLFLSTLLDFRAAQTPVPRINMQNSTTATTPGMFRAMVVCCHRLHCEVDGLAGQQNTNTVRTKLHNDKGQKHREEVASFELWGEKKGKVHESNSRK